MAIRPMSQAQRQAASPFSAYFGIPVSNPKPKTKRVAKKKAVPKTVVSVAPNERHRDMMGREINQNDYVLAVQGNRPFPFKVLKLNDTTLTMVPAIDQKNIKCRVSGGSVPAYKTYRRECWNVYVIPKEEIFMFNLKGNL
jgi:hypothetical protein